MFSLPRHLVVGIAASLFIATAAIAGYPISDGAEAGLGNWSADPPWNVTTAAPHAGSYAFTDSPGTNYANNADVSLRLAQNLDLSHATRPRLLFWHRYTLEQGYDFGRVEISLDGGATWNPTPLATYTGSTGWVTEQIDLATYVGQSAVKIRFRLRSDGSVTQDGWSIDDVLVDEAPAPVTLNAPAGATANTLALSWSSSSDPAFASYRLVRGMSAGFDWRHAATVATIAERPTTAASDLRLAPKTTYFYRLLVTRANGLETASNEVSGTTLAGMDVPFIDTGETGPATWVADYPWALSNERARGGTNAWSDSPGGPYAPNLGGASLTLSAPLDLSASTRPVLSFWHTAEFPGNDHGLVEVSTDGALTWTAVRDLTNVSITTWTHVQVDLTPWRAASVLLRFRVTTDSGTEGDGWHVDDISVSEQPSVVAAPALADLGPQRVTLSWLRNADTGFDHYAIHRAEPAGATFNSALVAEIPLQATTSFVDSALLIGMQYAWRVYAVNRYGAYGPDSPTESSATTSALPLPFADDFEHGLANWNIGGAWSTTPLVAHGGGSSLQDAPGDYPASSDTALTTQLDLRGTTWPVLSFWDRVDFQVNADAGHVQVSTDGASWTSVYAATGTRPGWLQREIDLSQWKGQARVWVRFRVRTDGAIGQDGWYVDDLQVADRNPAPVSLPFRDGFEAGTTAWLAGSWETSGASGRQGTTALEDFPRTMVPFDGWFAAYLSRPFDLSGTSEPQLVFWINGTTGYQQSIRAQASVDGGVNWSDIWVTGGYGAWTRVQVPLAPWRSASTRLRFVTTSGCCWDAPGIAIDDVAVEEAPVAPTMGVPAPHLKSMDVSWSAPGIANFRRYEVYRAAHAGVDFSATRIATITAQNTTSCTDTGLSIGKTYFYRVYVVSTDEVYTPSNEVSNTTTPLQLPVIDAMESDANWVAEGTVGQWGLGTTNPHGGAAYFSDSPLGAYPDSMDASLTTAVDLSGATWPVLRFWDRFAYQDNADAGHVEISIDSGGSWTPLYAATGTRDTWTLRAIDLSPYKGYASVVIRFRSQSDGVTVGDGWSVDDVAIAENAAPARTLPFADGFEAGTDNWLAGSWEVQAEGAHQGAKRLKDFPRTMIPFSGWFLAALSGTFDLSATTSPQWAFWVKGSTGYQQSIRAQISTDGGRTWGDLWATGGNWPNWTRVQLSLESYRAANVRLRFATTSGCCWDGTGIAIDDIAVEEAPATPTMSSPVPHLKGMDLSWSAPQLPNFKQYEVYRATHPGVDLGATRIAVITDRATTSCSDSGLSIGKSYWYRVYVVTTGDVYAPSNEVVANTTALALPVHDAMESGANWVLEGTGGTWGVGTSAPHEGSGYWSDSPEGNYPDGMDASLITAVNLAGATWPVLTFWDRFDFQVGADSGHVEVSIDSGNSWTGVYAAAGTSSGWARRRIDLSPWKGYASVMVRFRTSTDGATNGDGWSVDDLTVADDTTQTRALPFHDGFESGPDNWFTSNWEPRAPNAHGGATALQDFVRSPIAWGGWFATHLAGALDLSSTTAPQLTFWISGSTGYQQAARAQVSTDAGRTWLDVWATGGTWPLWTRVQVPLAPWRQADLRLRFVTSSGCCWDGTGVRIDDVAVEDALAKPAVNLPDMQTMHSQRLTWGRSPAPNAARYVIYRNRTGNVTEADTAVATINDPGTTSWVDLGLEPRSRYFYRVFVYTTHDTSTGSDEVQGLTLGAPLPFMDSFETDSGAWTVSGQWGRETGLGRNGTTALTDGPGVYPNSSDTEARIGVDLQATVWPILTFHEKHDFQVDADYGRVEVSSDYGASWTGVIALSGTNSSWTERRVDLSPWRNQGSVWIRFHVVSDGAVGLEGWTIDDVSVGENTVAARAYPFFEGFEGNLDRWLPGQWMVTAPGARRGTGQVDNSPGYSNPGNGWFTLTLGTGLDLTGATTPAWTFYIRGTTGWAQSIRAQVSTDGGLTWIDLWATGISYPEWTRISLPLDAYKRADMRFRFVHTAGYTDQEGVYIDDVGIGEPTPGAPSRNAPAEGETVGVLRPTLVLANADDPQADPLTYAFEVYSDAALTNRVAQVPAVAEGGALTPWTVDIDLANNHQYWWRARASDGSNTGPWMPASTFFVAIRNDAPSVPEFVSPPNGAMLWGSDAPLTWYRSVDPNLGDSVTYDLTIDDDPSFATPAVDEHGITDAEALKSLDASPTITVTLGSLHGYASLSSGHLYYWRLRAVDGRGLASSWTGEVRYFSFGSDTATPTIAWSTPQENGVVISAPIILSGTAQDVGSGLDYIQVSTDGGATWQLAAGSGSWSFEFVPLRNGAVAAQARAADHAGNISTIATRRFVVDLPDVPRSPRAVPDNSVITIAWEPPALAGATGYHVYRSPVSGEGYTRLTASPLAGTIFRDTGLANGTAYFYVVTALYASRPESAWSPEVTARPMGTGRAPFVDDLAVRRSGSDLHLAWTAVTADPGTGPALCPGYWVYDGATPSFTPSGSGSRHYVSGASDDVFAGAITDGKRHFFLVTATGADGLEGFHTQWFGEDDDERVTHGGSWAHVADPGASGGTLLASSTGGARVTITFSGVGASLSLARGPAEGIAQVYLDGTPSGTIDLYAPNAILRDWPYHVRGLVNGTHTLEIAVTGTNNAASSGTRIALDRLLVGREPLP